MNATEVIFLTIGLRTTPEGGTDTQQSWSDLTENFVGAQMSTAGICDDPLYINLKKERA